MKYGCELLPKPFKATHKRDAIIPVNGVIHWHIANYTPDMDEANILQSVNKGFQAWQLYFYPITFVPTSDKSKAPIIINFAKNGDPKLPIPFEPETLAYAFFPQGKSLGIHADIYFNDDISWADLHSSSRTSLFKVFVHELGHAFGIDHSDDIKDILYPIYQPNNTVIITKDTQNAINYLYGDHKRKIKQIESDNLIPSIEERVSKEKNVLLDYTKALFPTASSLRRLSSEQLILISKSLGANINPNNSRDNMAYLIRNFLTSKI